MKKLDIENVDMKDGYYHFTRKSNLKSIKENGLIPKIGYNAKNIESTPKVFFSKGAKGILELSNVWIRWMMFKKQKSNYTDKEQSPQEYWDCLSKFYQDFIDEKIYTEDELQEVYQDFYEYMENNIYFKLDLTEGEDFKFDDIDDVKQDLVSRPELLQAMYGKLTDNKDNPYMMEEWNMHTISGKGVSADKISLMKVGDSYSALDMLQYVYDNADKKDLDLKLLDTFMDYKQKRQEDSLELK